MVSAGVIYGTLKGWRETDRQAERERAGRQGRMERDYREESDCSVARAPYLPLQIRYLTLPSPQCCSPPSVLQPPPLHHPSVSSSHISRSPLCHVVSSLPWIKLMFHTSALQGSLLYTSIIQIFCAFVLDKRRQLFVLHACTHTLFTPVILKGCLLATPPSHWLHMFKYGVKSQVSPHYNVLSTLL